MGSKGMHLFGLVALAIGQPLLDLMSRNTALLVAHRMGPEGIAALLGILLVGLPLVFWGLELVLAHFVPRAVESFHTALVALLLGLVALGRLRNLPLPGEVAVVLALVLGAFGAFMYRRVEAVRMFASVLSIAPVVSLFVFISNDSVRRLLVEDHELVESEIAIETDYPIVLVIFDALPLSSLLTLEGSIDRVQFPGFASLADDSTWFRNTGAVSPWTMSAVPAILTGRLPNRLLDATLADHPKNIFTLLAGSYEMHVEERYTALYPAPEGEARDDGAPTTSAKIRSFLSDLAVLYIHIVSPDDINPLPPLDEVWKDFASWRSVNPNQMAVLSSRNSKKRFREFIDGIEASPPGGRPILHFLHVLLPHAPFRYTPSGDAYWPQSVQGLNRTGGPIVWTENEWHTVQAYQRHLLQLRYTDKLLADLIAHLKGIGIYDTALIAVTADHGNSFWPGEAQRAPMLTDYPEDAVSIPLFIKAPRQDEARVVERIVESIDVLATIADVLELKIPWSLDGCSALSEECPERSVGTMYDIRNGTTFEFDRTLFERRATLERKQSLFGNGIYRVGPRPDLLGNVIHGSELEILAGVRAKIGRKAFDLAGRHPDHFTLGRIVGWLEHSPGAEVPRIVGVVIDSIVRAVVPVTPKAGTWNFSAMLPDDARPESLDQVQIVDVSGLGGETLLRLIDTGF
jgi:hypothetical protein